MKTLRIAAIVMIAGSVQAQTLQTIKTYHDPLTKTQLHEVYTVKANTPTKQGSYKEYDWGGILIDEATFSNNQYNGVHKIYFGSEWNEPSDYRVGKIQQMENYVNGLPVGLSEQYQYINGQKFFLWQKVFNNKGDLIKQTLYHKSNGGKASILQLNGLCNEWYENGQKMSEYTHKNGEPDGKYMGWHENGKVKYEGQFSNGQKTGVWKTYTEDGTLEKEETF